MANVTVNPGMYESMSIRGEDFEREGVKHKTVVFNADNEFTARVSKAALEVIEKAWPGFVVEGDEVSDDQGDKEEVEDPEEEDNFNTNPEGFPEP